MPAPPYYSIQLGGATSRKQALARMKLYANERHIRAELRKSGWQIRVGVYPRRQDAEAALEAFVARGTADGRILAMETTVPWLLPDGSTLPLARPKPAAPAPAPAAAVAAAPAPEPIAPPPATAPAQHVPAVSREFREAARDLDSDLRRVLAAGADRRDGFVYGIDVGPVLLYAAQRRDLALYERLLPSARRLIQDSSASPYTRGFVQWRQKAGVRAEVSGAAEMMWMARALWAGAEAFQRDEDRALATRVLEGYERHAYELQGVWLVRKYFSFDGGAYASLSALPGYHGDFLMQVASGDSRWRELADRSYAVIERAVSPSGLLYPVLQPEVGASYPGLGLDRYAPNNITSLEESCLGVEGVTSGRPKLAKTVLKFVRDDDHQTRTGQLYAYYDATTGEPVGPTPLNATGYACLGRLAAAFDDDDAMEVLQRPLADSLRTLAQIPQAQDAPLYLAGPLLLTAHALGALGAP